jgi:hypothetical protein
MTQALFGARGWGTLGTNDMEVLLRLLSAAGIAFFVPNAQWWEKTLTPNRTAAWSWSLGALFAASYFAISQTSAPNIFLYWQF